MRISIIPEDKKIIVDGKTIDLESDAPWDFDDEHIHAIQWKDGYGSLEYEDIPGEIPVPNKIFGDDEFLDIVQPYLDYYNSFLTIYEKKELEASLAEEENLAKHIEELNLDKLEKEAQLVIIEDLQRQNKELRDEREALYDEQNILLQKEVFDQETARMEIERQKIAHESELSVLERQKAEEYFKSKAIELQNNYDKLLEEFETQKESFIEERKQYQKLLEIERDKIEKELEDSEKQLAEEDAKREKQRKIDELLHMQELEQIDLVKMELEQKKQEFEMQWEINQETINQQVADRKRFELDMDLELENLEKKRRAIQDYEAKSYQLILDEELENNIMTENEKEINMLQKQLEEENHKHEHEESINAANYLKELIEQIDNKLNENENIQLTTLPSQTDLDNITARIESLANISLADNQKDYSIDDILTLMDEVDPENLYNTLTNKQSKESDFPVEKAVKWFSALKNAIDKNS